MNLIHIKIEIEIEIEGDVAEAGNQNRKYKLKKVKILICIVGLTNIHLYRPGYSLENPQLFTDRFLIVVEQLRTVTFRSFDTGINSYPIWYAGRGGGGRVGGNRGRWH